MKSSTQVFGRIVDSYKISLDEVNELNDVYDKAKSSLSSYGPKLAGRLESELNFTKLIESTNMFKTLVNCMQDHLKNLFDLHILQSPKYNLDILSCWINDMKEGEYNPPHTHHDLSGWSTVLFLKVPEFLDDTKDPHKFRDGQLGFIDPDGVGTRWVEPKVGDLYIFEARHQHCVMPFKTKIPGKIRRSMSFNFIIKK